jgi:hypothetical protein
MKTLPNGMLLIQAAEDFGGFYQEEMVQASSYQVKGNEAHTIWSGMSFNDAGVSLDRPPQIFDTEPVSKSKPRNRQISDDIATKQKTIKQEIQRMTQGNKMSFQTAWQRLQSTRPELFSGLEPKVIHPD